jgi:hypothetical protein
MQNKVKKVLIAWLVAGAIWLGRAYVMRDEPPPAWQMQTEAVLAAE